MINKLEGLALRDALAQAASMAVKQARQNQYVGAWHVADAILNESAETVAHKELINGLRDEVVDASKKLLKSFPR